MTQRLRQWFLPILASVVVVLGLSAGVAANSGTGLPSWGQSSLDDLSAGPLGLNPQPEEGQVPVSIRIPAAEVDAEVEQNRIVDGVPLDPSGPWVVAWYQETALAGADSGYNNVVMSGHVDYWNVGPAVFRNVGNLQPGAEIEVIGEDGEVFVYAVDYVETVDIDSLEAGKINEIFGRTDQGALTLITCGGTFDDARGEYLSRIIVRANLVGSQEQSQPAAGETETDTSAAEEQPQENTETPTDELAVGSQATLTGDGVNLRTEPSTDSEVVAQLGAGDTVTITGGPESGGSFTWWQIQTSDGETGWVAEDFLNPAG